MRERFTRARESIEIESRLKNRYFISNKKDTTFRAEPEPRESPTA